MEKTTHKDTFLLGRTRSHNPRRLAYVSADVRLGKRIGTFPTVEHESITDPVILAIQFSVGFRLPGADWDDAVYHAGQVQPGDRKIVREPLRDKYRWGERDAYGLRHTINTLWREWHLNDMSAACAHQTVPADIQDIRQADPTAYLSEHVRPCPITGYRWGSQWLIKPLTEAAMERIASLDLTEVTTPGA